jgi:AbrB family looped-hinge helix DNA binding protein
MKSTHVTMARDGRIVIPAVARKALGLPDGGALVLRIEAGVIMLEPISHAIARAQAMVKPYATPGVLMSDELIADRRAEAAKEDAEECS